MDGLAVFEDGEPAPLGGEGTQAGLGGPGQRFSHDDAGLSVLGEPEEAGAVGDHIEADEGPTGAEGVEECGLGEFAGQEVGGDEADHAFVGVELDAPEDTVGFEPAEAQAGQEPGETVQAQFGQGFWAGIFQADGAGLGVAGAEAGVLVAVVAGDAGEGPGAIELIPAREVGGGGIEDATHDVVGVPSLVDQEVGQQAGQAAGFIFEVGVEVVDLHAGQLGAIPGAGFFGMGVEQHAAVFEDLPGQRSGLSPVIEHDTRGHAEGHQSLFHLEAGDEQFALIQPAPLEVEVRAPLDAVVAEADEIALGRDEHAQDLVEGHLTVVGVLGVTVQDAAIFLPVAAFGHGLAIGAEGSPSGFLFREPHETVVECAAQIEPHGEHAEQA